MPEKLLVYDATNNGVTIDGAIAKARAVGCTAVLRGLTLWMQAQAISFGTDGYVAVLVCLVPEHNARHEVLATYVGSNLTAAQIAVVRDHTLPTPEQDMPMRVRAVDTSGIADITIRMVLERLKAALTGG